ncbi:uncharacterized protein DFL_000333 [Arthrobotrys flagrans]|uniref:Uncharacterized protein n=1 Tax=Arthrobotrys flagrans TaxID=97331 RepID=A0A437AF42_ARTFL|nr:hypothetical protein DFL_000333 [Arthrobotrys flagrans]
MLTTPRARCGNSTIQSNIDIQIAVNVASQAQLNYKRNKKARETYHVLYPLPGPHHPGRTCKYIDMIEIPYPKMFPKSVAKFVEMSGNDVRSLLTFYRLKDLEDSVLAPPDTDYPGNFLFSTVADRETARGKYQCMQILAHHIGLKLDLLKHEGLKIFRERYIL